MELRLAFTEFLLAFCAVVMADRVYGFSARLASLFFKSESATKHIAPALSDGMAHDWYVHFHRGTLTGDLTPATRKPAPAARSTTTPAKRPRTDSRPRLRA